MLQNVRNEQGDSQGNAGRGSNDMQDRKKYEGFEGMNYEQRRRPYNPQKTGVNNMNDNDGARELRDEL